MRRTSRGLGVGEGLSVGEREDQKVAAWGALMRGPRPANSRSRGRKTAVMKGRMEVKVKSHISIS